MIVVRKNRSGAEPPASIHAERGGGGNKEGADNDSLRMQA
jgi:hypothetical protein